MFTNMYKSIKKYILHTAFIIRKIVQLHTVFVILIQLFIFLGNHEMPIDTLLCILAHLFCVRFSCAQLRVAFWATNKPQCMKNISALFLAMQHTPKCMEHSHLSVVVHYSAGAFL